MSFTVTPQIQKLSDDSFDFAIKAIMLGSGSELPTAEEITAMVQSSLSKAVTNNPTASDPIKTTVAGLQVVDDALTLAGKASLADYDEEAIQVLNDYETNGGHMVLAGIKSFLEGIFKKKAA